MIGRLMVARAAAPHAAAVCLEYDLSSVPSLGVDLFRAVLEAMPNLVKLRLSGEPAAGQASLLHFCTPRLQHLSFADDNQGEWGGTVGKSDICIPGLRYPSVHLCSPQPPILGTNECLPSGILHAQRGTRWSGWRRWWPCTLGAACAA